MDQNGLYDIYGHWHVPFWQTRWFVISIVITLGLVLIGLAWLLFKKYYRKKELSAAHKALAHLAALEKRPIATRAQAQQIYFAITDILKQFFQATYGCRFEGLTDQEMLAKLPSYVPEGVMPLVTQLVDASLNVKYAQEHALKEQVLQQIATAKTSILKVTTVSQNR